MAVRAPFLPAGQFETQQRLALAVAELEALRIAVQAQHQRVVASDAAVALDRAGNRGPTFVHRGRMRSDRRRFRRREAERCWRRRPRRIHRRRRGDRVNAPSPSRTNRAMVHRRCPAGIRRTPR